MANDPADTHLDKPADKAAEAKESAPDKGLIQTLWEGIEAELKKAAAEKDGGESGADSRASSKGDSKIDAKDEKLYKSYFDATPDDAPKAFADGGPDSKPDKAADSGRDRGDAEAAREAAVALFAALNPVFTAEKAIFAALEGRSAEELRAVKDEFERSFGVDLETRLSEELDGDDRKYALDLLNQRGEALVPIPPGSSRAELRAANETINGAFAGWYSVDREKVLEALAGKSPADLEAMNALYKERFGRSLDEEFDEGFPPRTRSQWVELAAEWKAERDGLESAKKTVDREAMAGLAGKIHDYEPDLLDSVKHETFAVMRG